VPVGSARRAVWWVAQASKSARRREGCSQANESRRTSVHQSAESVSPALDRRRHRVCQARSSTRQEAQCLYSTTWNAKHGGGHIPLVFAPSSTSIHNNTKHSPTTPSRRPPTSRAHSSPTCIHPPVPTRARRRRQISPARAPVALSLHQHTASARWGQLLIQRSVPTVRGHTSPVVCWHLLAISQF
jgi:hypothetical protein